LLADASLGKQLLARQIAKLPGVSSGGDPSEWQSQQISLAPGLAIELAVAAGRARRQFNCTLDARPQGICSVRATFKQQGVLSRDYECKVSTSNRCAA